MRIVFIGASALTLATAAALIRSGHDVVIIERDKAKIDTVGEDLDCGFIQADGTKPAILREANPDQTDILFCLTDSDRDNILASLVGRSIGFKRVVTKIENAEFMHICTELGLSDTIVPDDAMARLLVDMAIGEQPVELTTFVRDDARFFSFFIREQDAGRIEDLALPDRTRIVCIYRGSGFLLPEEGERLKDGDEVLVVTHKKNLAGLSKRWGNPSR